MNPPERLPTADPTGLEPARTGEGAGGGSREAAAGLDPTDSQPGNSVSKDFVIFDSVLAVKLGVTRDRLRELRWAHLKENVEFIRKNRRVAYTVAGAAHLAGLACPGLPLENALPEGTTDAGDAVALPLQTFKVRRIPANTHLLECVASDDRVVVVRVRWQENFRPGMIVNAIPYGDLPDVFEFAGAYPRFRGKY